MKTNSKYNRSEIMKEAWNMFKEYGNLSFSECLKWSWNIAKGIDSVAVEIENMSVKDIFNSLYYNSNMNSLVNDEILKTVAKNSKGFQSDIANKVINGNEISEKQAWCVAYEYKNVA